MKIFKSILLSKILLILSPSVFAGSGFTFVESMRASFGIKTPGFIITYFLISLLILTLGFIYRAKIHNTSNTLLPDNGFSFRNMFEAVAEFIYNLASDNLGEKEAPKYFPFLFFVFITILINNLIGLVPGFLPSTENINTTFAMGIFAFIFYNYAGVKEQGWKGHIGHLMGPILPLAVIIFPIEVISHSMRPMTLALRLRANLYADHALLETFSNLVPLVVPLFALCLGVIVCVVQALVFTLLTMVYIGLAIEHQDHDDHESVEH